MTVDDEISRIETGKDNIRKFSESRGVPIPVSETIDQYTQYLNQIPTSGVFFAEYNVTSFQDVLAAFRAGKNIWVANLGNFFIPLFKVDNTENPQLFTFQRSHGVSGKSILLGLSGGETYWQSNDFVISATDIPASVPANLSIRENIQGYLDYLNDQMSAKTTAPRKIIVFTASYGVHQADYPNFLELTRDYLGMTEDDFIIDALGGTGFSNANPNKRFVTRITARGQSMTEVSRKAVSDVYILGGGNDAYGLYRGTTTTAEITTLRDQAIGAAHQYFPNAAVRTVVATRTLDPNLIPYMSQAYQIWVDVGRLNATYAPGMEASLNDNKLMSPDNTHPSRVGHKWLAGYLSQLIQQGFTTVYRDTIDCEPTEKIMPGLTATQSIHGNTVHMAVKCWGRISPIPTYVCGTDQYILLAKLGRTFATGPVKGTNTRWLCQVGVRCNEGFLMIPATISLECPYTAKGTDPQTYDPTVELRLRLFQTKGDSWATLTNVNALSLQVGDMACDVRRC